MKYIAIIDAEEKPVSCEFIGCNGNVAPYLIGATTDIKALEQKPCWIPMSDKQTNMTAEEAIKTLKGEAWICCSEKWNEALGMAFKALKQFDALNEIRAEIERLHYHPKLDFIKNDDVVDMALEIIDKYRTGVSE